MKTILIPMSLALVFAAQAEVVKIQLPQETASYKTGPGVDLANGQCLTCHSADYISMQPPKGADFWKAEVGKMKAKYGAPIADDQVTALIDYFSHNYGTEKGAVTTHAPTVSTTMNPKDLAASLNCLVCHSVNMKIVGPAYKDVAAKYRGNPEGMTKVAHQITHGGGGQWGGPVVMPPFPNLTTEQVKILSEWILSQ